MPGADRLRLQDILEYGRLAVEVGGEPPRRLRQARNRLALERALFLVGEAAARLTPRTRQAMDQPWPDIIGLRNVLAHRYDSVRLERLRGIATQRVPDLLAAVQGFLREG